jgi:hypothetical protein
MKAAGTTSVTPPKANPPPKAASNLSTPVGKQLNAGRPSVSMARIWVRNAIKSGLMAEYHTPSCSLCS